MRSLRALPTLGLLAVLPLAAAAAPPEDDPLAWLEEVLGERQLAWVQEQNARSLEVLMAQPEYQPIFDRTLEILDSKDKIPYPQLHGTTVYNFWKDDRHERGIWRRTSLTAYRAAQPHWETVDVDALAAAEGEPWVWKGASCLPPEYRRCMVSLSRGGADAVTVRELDTATKAFVEDGFFLPEAKSFLSWRDADHLWVGTDVGPGSLTTSGYARLAKLWKRGTPLAEAVTLFEGEPADVAVGGFSVHTRDGRYDLVQRTPALYRAERFLVLGDRLVALDLPEDVVLHLFFADHLLLSLHSDWEVGGRAYGAGSLLAIDLDDFLRGGRQFDVLFEPTERVSLADVASTSDRVLVETLDNVRSRLASFTRGPEGWRREEVELPGLGTAAVIAASDETDVYLLSYQDFLTPSSVWLVESGGRPGLAKTMPAFFDTEGMAVVQHEAARQANRMRIWEDFIAVAEDLVTRRITSPRRLGIIGDSQGGLLVGGAFTMRPDLFGAVVSEVPLADMRRYHQLLAGASWIAEYGDPDDPNDWAFIQTWSPYHLLRADAEYPTPFYWTNTRDDRVHPAHARKMVAKMLELGHPVYYFENTAGGHGSGTVNRQTAHVTALEYAYLWKMLR
jgi:prolyl oligopeptidase